MKKNKLLGIVLIISALLLQVGYAQTIAVPSEKGTASVDGYHVQFKEVNYEASKYVTVTALPSNNGHSVDVNVENLYPGASFTISPSIQNQGTKPVKITEVKVLAVNVQDEKDFILNGYDTENNVVVGGTVGYAEYLTNKYVNQKLLVNETIPLTLKMVMKEEVTEMKNQTVGFKLQVSFEQLVEESSSGGSGTGSSSSSTNTNIEPQTVPVDKTTIPDEVVPGGLTDIPNERVPGGSTNVPDEVVPGGKTNVPDEKIPGGGLLPKTGGTAAIIVYALGIIMLVGGIFIYTKKRKNNL